MSARRVTRADVLQAHKPGPGAFNAERSTAKRFPVIGRFLIDTNNPAYAPTGAPEVDDTRPTGVADPNTYPVPRWVRRPEPSANGIAGPALTPLSGIARLFLLLRRYL